MNFITIKKNSKHIIINFMGIKFILKRRYSRKFADGYYKYLENGTNNIKDFVQITNNKYEQSNSVKPIAFYLPQFHQIPINDKNFGKGFTEWTNVAKARPQFKNHYQPHIPIDVGFYDLSHDDVMYRQIELAKMYGIYGFCFYYYWFSGKKLLEKPINNLLNNKNLNIPFCICWANESWLKLWDGGNQDVIMQQKLEDNDDKKFFYDILPFFKDERYIKINNKPVLLIYRADYFGKTNIIKFIQNIRKMAINEGFDGITILGIHPFNYKEYSLDGLVEFPPHFLNFQEEECNLKYINKNFVGKIFNTKKYIENKEYMKITDNNFYQGIFCGWDNTARKSKSNAGIYLCNPKLYKKWLSHLIEWTKRYHNKEDQFIFINAWNEWAEGTHLEPDYKYGYAYLQATKDALEENA